MITPEIKELLKKYRGSTPAQVALQASRFPELPIAFVAQQLKGREKARKKLPSWCAAEDVAFPPSLNIEQSSSELTAAFKASLIEQGKLGVDLTGGFGVDSRFFAERFEGFRYCEKDVVLSEIVAHNLGVFGLADRVSVFSESCIEKLGTEWTEFDFAYLDPARRDKRGYRMSAFRDCDPDLLEHWTRLRAAAKTIMVKASPGLDISLALSELSGVSRVYVVSVENECKELLFIAGGEEADDVAIHCVDLSNTREPKVFSFRQSEEAQLEPSVGIPSRYLFEPNAAVMKGGGFKSLSHQFGLKALNPRTRLYCLDEPRRDLPGRVFEIVGNGSLNAKDAKRLFPNRKANVISRNSGMSADELKKKLKLRDGGSSFAIGAAVSDVGRQLFSCRLMSD